MNSPENKIRGYYPVVVRDRTIGLSELSESTAAIAHLNAFQVEMVLKMAMKTIVKELLNSNYVCLDDFGTFMLAAESRHVESADEIRAESISVKKITFKTSLKLQRKLQTARFEKVK